MNQFKASTIAKEEVQNPLEIDIVAKNTNTTRMATTTTQTMIRRYLNVSQVRLKRKSQCFFILVDFFVGLSIQLLQTLHL